MKIKQKSVFIKRSFKKPMKLYFFENVFQQQGSLGSCATFSETSCPYLFCVLRNLPHNFEKRADVTKSAKKKHRRDGMSHLGTSRNVQWSAEGVKIFCDPGPTTL